MLAAIRRIRDHNIRLVYMAILLLGLAYGTAIAIISIYLDLNHYSKVAIGSLAAWFAGGIVLFSLPMGWLIRRFGAKVTLVTSLFGYAFTVSLFPWAARSFLTLAAVRFADGGFSVGIWVSCETILLARANRDTKGFIMGLYAVCMGIGYVAGPLLARGLAAFAPLPVVYWTAGGIAATSGLLALLRLDRDADTPVAAAAAPGELARAAPPATLLSLLWRIKNSCFATFVYGYYEASIVLFMPLYLFESRGITREQTIIMPAFFAVGILTFSTFAGRLGDRHGHLNMMRILALAGTIMTALFVLMPSYWLMCAAVFIGGVTLGSVSVVSLALQGLVVPVRDYARANALYNAFFAAGMLLGPPISSRIFTTTGGQTMLLHLAGLWAAFTLFTLVFRRDDPRAGARTVAPAVDLAAAAAAAAPAAGGTGAPAPAPDEATRATG